MFVRLGKIFVGENNALLLPLLLLVVVLLLLEQQRKCQGHALWLDLRGNREKNA